MHVVLTLNTKNKQAVEFCLNYIVPLTVAIGSRAFTEPKA